MLERSLCAPIGSDVSTASTRTKRSHTESSTGASKRQRLLSPDPFRTSTLNHPAPSPSATSTPSDTAATRLPDDVFELIFTHLKAVTIDQALPPMPIRSRDRLEAPPNNSRLTRGEVTAYKKAMMRKQLFDLGKVCKNWWNGASRAFDEVVIIGDSDVLRACRNPTNWLPLQTDRPFKLTVQCAFGPFYALVKAMLRHRPAPIQLESLTLLHSWTPQSAAVGMLYDDIRETLKSIAPKHLHIEWFSGETILSRRSIDDVAKRLRKPFHHALTEEERLLYEGYHEAPHLDAVPEKRKKFRKTTRREARRANRQAELWGDMGIPSHPEDPHDEASSIVQRVVMRNKQRRWIMPNGWDPEDNVPGVLTRLMLQAWSSVVESFTIRANWLSIHHQVRMAAQHGKLRKFDYNFVPICRSVLEMEKPLVKPWLSKDPPVGALRSLDNILMWDMHERPRKWYNRRQSRLARKHEQEYSPPERRLLLEWTVHTPVWCWLLEKDRVQFRGDGRGEPFESDKSDIIRAIGEFLCDEASRWERPVLADKMQWDMRWTFEEMTWYVIEPFRRREKRVKDDGPSLLLDAKNKRFLDPGWIQDHVSRCQRKEYFRQWDNAQAEEEAINDPNPMERQLEYNRWYVEVWLRMKTEEERMEIIARLRKKYGGTNLWSRMNWPLVQPSYPGVELRVETVPR
ncbi:hypothetical protein EHS25_003541 [Saitozyma podzolica]|uniref:Uncharacterized protein n=1 Tax=Saitozyma podzolica TaxID=1890683 RepID=A0A427Y7J6_9TREE|nr:hypothetical protein EHS25_003541 [Saitozyma podzolica]